MDEGPKTYVDGKWVPLTRRHVDRLVEVGEEAARVEPAVAEPVRPLTRKERRRFARHFREKSLFERFVEECTGLFG